MHIAAPLLRPMDPSEALKPILILVHLGTRGTFLPEAYFSKKAYAVNSPASPAQCCMSDNALPSSMRVAAAEATCAHSIAHCIAHTRQLQLAHFALASLFPALAELFSLLQRSGASPVLYRRIIGL